MKGIVLGQYYPADSVIHRLDPRIKIILALIYIVCSFLCRNIFSFVLLFLSSIVLILVSRIPLKIVFRSLRAIIFIMLFTAVLNVFWTKGEPENLLVSWKFINIYTEGIYNAVFIVVRIVSMIIGSSIFMTYTTTPIQLTDGIERLLSPLKKLHVPVHEFAMMMTIALRFIPIIVEETQKIMSAQKARGADFSSGSLMKRAKALVPVLIPLFISAQVPREGLCHACGVRGLYRRCCRYKYLFVWLYYVTLRCYPRIKARLGLIRADKSNCIYGWNDENFDQALISRHGFLRISGSEKPQKRTG